MFASPGTRIIPSRRSNAPASFLFGDSADNAAFCASSGDMRVGHLSVVTDATETSEEPSDRRCRVTRRGEVVERQYPRIRSGITSAIG